MDNKLIPDEQFQVDVELIDTSQWVPYRLQTEVSILEGSPTTRSLDINSVSNNDVYQTYDIPTTPEIGSLEMLKIYLDELLIRFDASPQYYQKEDYKQLILTLYDTLTYLYGSAIATTDSLQLVEEILLTKVDKIDGWALSQNDLTNILKSLYDLAYIHSQSSHAPVNAEQNINANWNATSGDAYILNKPIIPSIEGLATETYVQNYAEPKIISKKTAFNKDFGTTSGTVLEGRTFGTAANSNTTAFASAYQGGLAESAVQPESLPSFGSAAESDASDFATAAQGSLADTAVQSGDLPLFGDIVTHSTNDFATSTQGATADTALEIAKGANQALAYYDYASMVSILNNMPSDELMVGQNIYIQITDVPDIWVSGVELESTSYVFISDQQLIDTVTANGYVSVGYFQLSFLETQKVDLISYYTKDETDQAIEDYAEPANANIQSHISSTGNPHGTTYSDVGAAPALTTDENYVSDAELARLQSYPDLVTETENKFIRDDGTKQLIESVVGGYANNLYLGETDSDVPTYKILTYTADVAETLKTVTAQAGDGVVTAQTFLYPSGVSVATFPSGLWSLKLWGKISASAGVSQVGFTYFKRSTLGVETDLFTLWSQEINNTTDAYIDLVGTQPSYTVNPTDRMGLRLLFKTTSTSNKTLTYSIGDGYAAFVNNPNQIRHSQTRAKNDELAYQHIDQTTEKTTPIDADSIGLWDSVALKFVRTSLTNFKTVLSNTFAKLSGGNTFSGKQIFIGDAGSANSFEVRNGNATGSLLIGADVNASTKTNNIRKLARFTVPSFADITKNHQIFSADFDNFTIAEIEFGGSDGGTQLGCTTIGFNTVGAVGTNGGVRALTILKDSSTSHLAGKYNYEAVSHLLDTINDTRSSNVAGVKIEEICTVANATKGGGTWEKTTAKSTIGGYMISLTNKTGLTSVKGTVVYASATTDNAFNVNPIDGDMPFGIVYENGIADGAECWVVVSGIAEVLLVNSVAATRSYIAYASGTTAGRIDTAASAPAAALHFREIGHTLENKTAGTNVLVKCVLHFN